MKDSNNTYTLKEFFLGRSSKEDTEYRKIIIPDMQREYCWPVEKNPVEDTDLVTSFVKTLIGMSLVSNPVKIGLLYGYESPQYSIQLCDGQQRLTTLYLVIGMLFRSLKSSGDVDKELLSTAHSILISDFEERHDDKEPRLQYAIRESTLFFLRDLVENFFLGDTPLETLKKSVWYFDEYAQDPSIENIIKALHKIHDNIKDLTPTQQAAALDFVVNKLSFLYFDMRDRSHGEEQFVVINTTGKALTFSENLKPILLGKLSDDVVKEGKSELRHYSDVWENWEQFFWSTRVDKCVSDFVVDNQLEEFFRWVYIMEMSIKDTTPAATKKERYIPAQRAYNSSVNLLDISTNVPELLDTIGAYIDAYKTIIERHLWIENKKQPLPFSEKLSQADCFRFLPVLFFVKTFKCQSARQILRVQRLMWEISEHSNYSFDMAIVEMIRAIKLIYEQHKEAGDIALLVADDVYKKIRKAILPADSVIKLKTYLSVPAAERVPYENVIWDIENMDCCKGDMSFFYNEILPREDNVSLAEYQKLADMLNMTANNSNTLFRRSMLTYGDYHEHLSYSRRLDLFTYSFAKDAAYFKDVFRNKTRESSRKIITTFLLDMYQSSVGFEQFMTKAIDDYIASDIHTSNNDNWKCLIDVLIKNPSLFDYAKKGVVCYNDSKEGQPIARVFESDTLSSGQERTIKELGLYNNNKSENSIDINTNAKDEP